MVHDAVTGYRSVRLAADPGLHDGGKLPVFGRIGPVDGACNEVGELHPDRMARVLQE
jgi:hypothetical protein